jgi:hypothetical protein
VRLAQLLRLPQLVVLPQLVRLPQLLRLPQLVGLPQLMMLSQLVRLPNLVTEPYLRLQPPLIYRISHLGSQPQFILALLHSVVIKGVPHSWLNGSACVPATISIFPFLMTSTFCDARLYFR